MFLVRNRVKLDNLDFCRSGIVILPHGSGETDFLQGNRPCPSCLKPPFQGDAKCEAINMNFIFMLMQVKVIFRDKGFCTYSLVLNVRVFGTRKWPMMKLCRAI